MGISTNSCLNISPPPPLSTPSSLRKTTHVTWPKERSLKSQCVIGVACLIIGLKMDNTIGSRGDNGIAIAENMYHPVELNDKGNSRWSDKRACPPWQVNSLETIVPENLPRPAARRRWEGVDFSSTTAPAVKVVAARSSNGSCFTM